MAQSNTADPLLTVKQLAEREGITERHVRFLIRAKSLPAYRVGGIKVRLSEWRDWLRVHRTVAG